MKVQVEQFYYAGAHKASDVRTLRISAVNIYYVPSLSPYSILYLIVTLIPFMNKES